MDDNESAAWQVKAQDELLEILQDPRVRAFARRRANGDGDLAEDALQETCYAMLRLKRPAEIKSMRAYFYRSLAHEVARQRGQRGDLLIDDLEHTEERQSGGARPGALTEFEEAACSAVQAWGTRRRLLAARERLLASVPGRSTDGPRYRALVYGVADEVLGDLERGEPSEADSNEGLSAAYPEYFDQPGISRACHDQRLKRARDDVRALLQWAFNQPD